jgi:hypothetical protein
MKKFKEIKINPKILSYRTHISESLVTIFGVKNPKILFQLTQIFFCTWLGVFS